MAKRTRADVGTAIDILRLLRGAMTDYRHPMHARDPSWTSGDPRWVALVDHALEALGPAGAPPEEVRGG